VELDFYFDFVSPYGYLAWKRAPHVVPNVRLRPRPVVLGALLKHFGQLGPAEIAPKRAFTIRDTLRRAADARVRLTWPERHPFRSLDALRAVFATDERRFELVDALYCAGWERGENLEAEAVIRAAVVAAGLAPDSLLDRARSKALSDAYRAENDAAVAQGIFGVPTFVLDGEVFFGDDQLERIARKLAGDDPLDVTEARRVEARAMGIQRVR
jgi:2-hydroxychromene-2-carboxylate isomerase